MTIYNRASDHGNALRIVERSIQTYVDAIRKVRAGTTVIAPVAPSYEEYGEQRAFKYRIVKMYRHHFVCEFCGTKLRKSFTYADVATGWVVVK